MRATAWFRGSAGVAQSAGARENAAVIGRLGTATREDI
jgi:hypothetical protein